MQLILASASKGREYLLKLLKIPFAVMPSSIEEDKIVGKNPVETIKLRAKLKAEKVVKKLITHNSQLTTFILSSDTEVIINNQLLGKPKDYKDAVRMLKMLSGKTHEVVSGYYMIKITITKPEIRINIKQPKIPILKTELNSSNDRLSQGLDTTWQEKGKLRRLEVSEKFGIEAARVWHDFDLSRVTFRKLKDEDIKTYLSLTEYTRYTGGYAVIASPQDFITNIEGSLSNVIGLPLEKVIPIFKENKLLP